MTREELDHKLEKHKKWLAGDPDGERADLSWTDLNHANLCGADLSRAELVGAFLIRADLSQADLRGANLDFSCWPLWYGSLDVRIDKRLACQLLYYALRAMQSVGDAEVQEVCNNPANIALANQFHRVAEYGMIEPKHEETTEDAK